MKLSEMRDALNALSPQSPKRIELQKQINEREQWCIDQHPEWGVTLTEWEAPNPLYPDGTGYIFDTDLDTNT